MENDHSQTVICPRCGQKNQPGNYCAFCGAKLMRPRQEAQRQRQETPRQDRKQEEPRQDRRQETPRGPQQKWSSEDTNAWLGGGSERDWWKEEDQKREPSGGSSNGPGNGSYGGASASQGNGSYGGASGGYRNDMPAGGYGGTSGGQGNGGYGGAPVPEPEKRGKGALLAVLAVAVIAAAVVLGLVVLGILPPGGSGADGAPKDALNYGGNSYKIYEVDSVTTYQEAQDYCKKKGGHLAVITSQKLNDRLWKYVQEEHYRSAVFGYSDEEKEGSWTWVTSDQPSYTNWAPNEPNCASEREDCAMFDLNQKDGTWNDTEFGYSLSAFICQWGDEGIRDEDRTAVIPKDAHVYEDHSYYLYTGTGINGYAAAEQFCEVRGGHLAVLSSSEENREIVDYVRNLGYTAAFIGLYQERSGAPWVWVDGSTPSFTDWGINEDGEQEPNAASEHENYVTISQQMRSGSWNDEEWKIHTTAFVCEWDQ